jgi:hypothetical protein
LTLSNLAVNALEHKADYAEPWRVEPVNNTGQQGEIAYTTFPNQFAKMLRRDTATLPQLAERIRGMQAKDKGGLPFIKLAVFGDLKTEKQCYRHDANITAISGVEGDYDSVLIDGAPITFAEAVAKMRGAKVKALLYTTPSSTDAEPHWRALCPTSTQLAPEERMGLMDRLNGIFGGGFAGESWTLSQSYYFGSVEGRPAARVELVEGDCIDQCPEIIPVPKAASSTTRDAPEFVRTGQAYSVDQLRAMGAAAEIGCAELHYDQLRVVILGVLRLSVTGDDDGAIRQETAKAIWDANTTSQSLTDEKFDDLASRAGDLRYNEKDRVVGPGTFIHHAELGGWKPPPGPSSNETFAVYLDANPDGGQGEADDARLLAKFMRTENADAPLFKTTTLGDYLYAKEPAPERRDLVPDWIAADRFIPLCGPGGYHKSRLLQQLAFCKLYDRELFVPKTEPNRGRIGGPRECGGISVGRIELLSYEDPEAAMRRRVDEMKTGFEIPEIRDAKTDRFARHEVAMPMMRVGDDGKLDLTALGYAMLRRWEEMAGAGEHMMLWLDSFFDAIDFSQKARIDDAIARRVLRLLDHWCELLNATILAPFHPSRSGQDHGHTGYAPAFENAPRQVLRIGAKRQKVSGGAQFEYRETGEYVFQIHKWNDGQMGKRLSFWFAGGQLVSAGDMTATAASAAEAAVSILTRHTYGEAAAKFTVGTTAAEGEAIELSCTWRVRRSGKRWTAGHGGDAGELTAEHFVIETFREMTGNPRAQVRDFISACDAAVASGDLGYRESDRAVRSAKRLPAGYYVKFPEAEDGFAEPEMS